MEEKENQTIELYRKLWQILEEITKTDENFQKFKKEYLSKKDEWKKDYEAYKDRDTFHFIELACMERNIPVELSHRLMTDFGKFILLCMADDEIIKDAWIWKPKEWWFYFWKYYKTIFEDEKEKYF